MQQIQTAGMPYDTTARHPLLRLERRRAVARTGEAEGAPVINHVDNQSSDRTLVFLIMGRLPRALSRVGVGHGRASIAAGPSPCPLAAS